MIVNEREKKQVTDRETGEYMTAELGREGQCFFHLHRPRIVISFNGDRTVIKDTATKTGRIEFRVLSTHAVKDGQRPSAAFSGADAWLARLEQFLAVYQHNFGSREGITYEVKVIDTRKRPAPPLDVLP